LVLARLLFDGRPQRAGLAGVRADRARRGGFRARGAAQPGRHPRAGASVRDRGLGDAQSRAQPRPQPGPLMSELRRDMLDISDALAELSADLKFLASRQASLAALMLDYAEHYKVLYKAARESGTTEGIRTAALDAAGNLGTI